MRFGAIRKCILSNCGNLRKYENISVIDFISRQVLVVTVNYKTKYAELILMSRRILFISCTFRVAPVTQNSPVYRKYVDDVASMRSSSSTTQVNFPAPLVAAVLFFLESNARLIRFRIPP